MKKMFIITLSIIMMQMYMMPYMAEAEALYSTANEDGIYIMTPENVVEVIGDSWATDNNMIYRVDGNYTSYENVPVHSVSYGFDFDGNENTGYDLWILSTFNDNGVSTPMYAFDNDESERWEVETEGWNNQTVSPYTNDLAGSRFELYWNKVETNKTFSHGKHTLKYSVGQRWFDKYVLSCYGGAVLVPSNYNWTPTAETVLSNNGQSIIDSGFDASYAWIELEKYKTFSQYVGEDDPAEGMEIEPAISYSSTNNYSGNGCILMEGKSGEAIYTYDFKLDNSDSYDIWFLGTEFEMHISDFNWGIDITSNTMLNPIQKLDQYNSDVVYYATNQSFPVKWQKVAEGITIGAGQHEFTYKQNYRYIAPDRWGQADCIAIVPSEIEWQPTAQDKANFANANLDAKAAAYSLEKKYAEGVDENIDLPQMGPAGSRYMFESLTPDVILNNGAIVPSSEEDLNAELKITAYKAEATAEENAELVVLIDPNAVERIKNKVYVLTVDDVVDVIGSEWSTDNETIYRVEKDFGSSAEIPVHSISYGFNYDGNETVGYDIWILSTFNDNSLSTPMYSFDNDEPKRWAFETEGWNNQQVTPYFNYMVSTPFDLYWSKVETNKTFTKGDHILKYSVENRWFDSWIISCVSGAVLVPSSYNWTPDNNTMLKTNGRSTVETDFINPYALIELENFKNYTSETENANPCLGWNNANYSGNGCINMEGSDGEVTYTYDFELDNSGVYDMWFLGTDLAWSPLSNFKWGIDISGENELIACQQLEKTDALYQAEAGGFDVMWQKAAENISLTAGDHIFTYKQLYRADGPQRWGQADCIVLVPKGFEWTPTLDDKGTQLSATLDATALWYTIDRKYAKGAKDNIDIPQAGPAGSRYSFQSMFPEVIDEKGVIYPIGMQEQQGILNLIADKTDKNGQSSSEQYVYITVLPAQGVVVKNFKFISSNGEELTTLIGGETISAIAKILDGGSVKTNAIMVIALYNSNGSLNSVVKSDSISTTNEYQELAATMTLPEDVSGMTIKAYIWDDLSTGMPLIESISNDV